MYFISLPLPFAAKVNRNPEYADSPPKPKLCHLRITHKVGSNKAEYRNRKSRVGCAHFASPSLESSTSVKVASASFWQSNFGKLPS